MNIFDYLSERDTVLKSLIKHFGPMRNLTRKSKTPFDSLIVSILGQQLSSKVSDMIVGRLVAAVGPRPFEAKQLNVVEDQLLRNCGIARSKIKAIKLIAEKVLKGELDFENLINQEANSVRTRLIGLWGVGPWTADMFLIFSLKELDVFPMHDSGLERAHKLLYPEQSSLQRTAELWIPYRSVGCMYLWKYLDEK